MYMYIFSSIIYLLLLYIESINAFKHIFIYPLFSLIFGSSNTTEYIYLYTRVCVFFFVIIYINKVYEIFYSIVDTFTNLHYITFIKINNNMNQ